MNNNPAQSGITSSLILVGCVLGTVVMADDAEFTRKLAGVWNLAVTNGAPNQTTQWMSAVTTYLTNGSYVVTGEVGGEFSNEQPEQNDYFTGRQARAAGIVNQYGYAKMDHFLRGS